MRLQSIRRFAMIAVTLPLSARAQGVNLDLYKLPLPTPPAIGAEMGRAQPGATAASPIAYGPKWGDFFVGGGYQASTRYGGGQDGSVAAGMGLGDPARAVGLELVVASASTIRSGFGDRMYGSTKLHRILPSGAGIAIGLEGVSLSGTAQSDPAVYVAYTKVQQLNQGEFFNAITWNGGIGNGRFQSEDRVTAGTNGLGYFLSAAIRVSPKMAAVADWSGQDLNLGMSFAPFRSLPITISPALVDVLGTAGDGIRFTLGAGMSWSGIFARRGGASGPRPAYPTSGGEVAAAPSPTPVPTPPLFVPSTEPAPTPSKAEEPAAPAAPVAAAPVAVQPTPVASPKPVRRVPAPENNDIDGDGVPNNVDACPNSPLLGAVTAAGCLAEIVPDEKIEMANFSFGRSNILPGAGSRLDELVAAMKADASVRVEIGGHADEIGTDEVNVTISRQRAEAVKAYFVLRGVPAEQLVVKAYGRSMPIAPNDTPANRAKNRRVELTRLP